MKLAYAVAKAFERFVAVRNSPPNVFPSDLMRLLQRERANGHDGDPSRCDWEHTLLENVYLTRLVRVSTASWQPEIFVELPPVATLPASSSSSSQ